MYLVWYLGYVCNSGLRTKACMIQNKAFTSVSLIAIYQNIPSCDAVKVYSIWVKQIIMDTQNIALLT